MNSISEYNEKSLKRKGITADKIAKGELTNNKR